MTKQEILDLLEKYGVYNMTNTQTGETTVDISACGFFQEILEDKYGITESLLLIIDKDGNIKLTTGEL